MRNFDEHNITLAVLERVEPTASPRVRAVSEALVRHLHDFIREIEPTFEEWEAGIKFLTDVGHKCTSSRQEFILLSDTLGASMLVDAMPRRDGGYAREVRARLALDDRAVVLPDSRRWAGRR